MPLKDRPHSGKRALKKPDTQVDSKRKNPTTSKPHSAPPPSVAGKKRGPPDDMNDKTGDETNQAANGSAETVSLWDAATTVERDGWSYDALLEAACQPLSGMEITRWEGWCELESEPSFFNMLLSDLGVRNVKIQEIFNMDDDCLALLPKPVFGLIFLSRYLDQPTAKYIEEDTKGVWFANQTIENACATVAMLNIVMNCPQIEVGPELKQFKNETKDLISPLIGRALSANQFIRAEHNSLARRIDLLNSDLDMHSSAGKFNSAKKRKAPPKKKQKRAPVRSNKRPKVTSDSSFHYTAYVAANGWLWELDGLKPAPVKLGAIPPEGDLIAAARSHIRNRIEQFEDGSMFFNMMGLCQSPLATASMHLAQTIVHFEALRGRVQGDPELVELLQGSADQPFGFGDEAALQQYGLTAQSITNQTPDAAFLMKVSDLGTSAHDLSQMYKDLVTEQKLHMAAHRDESAALRVDCQRVGGRKHDNLAMINRWVTAIASHDKLEDLINGGGADDV